MKKCIVIGCLFLKTVGFAQKQISKHTYEVDTTKIVLSDSKTKLEINETKIIPANIIIPTCYIQHKDTAVVFIEKYLKEKRNYIISAFKKGAPFYKKIIPILKKYKVPQDLKVLVAIESNFNANAVSKSGAVGYWQFMDATSGDYGLKIKPKLSGEELDYYSKNDTAYLSKIDKIKDDRIDLIKSTTAAAKYLRDRQKVLKDWLLVVASFNAGEGTIRKAIASSGKSNPTFWDIKNKLPKETQDYVLKFIGLSAAYNNYGKFGNNTLTFSDKELKTKRVVFINQLSKESTLIK